MKVLMSAVLMNIAYCKNMGGVDLNDQICQYYDIICKSVKWWKKKIFHLLNMVIVNALKVGKWCSVSHRKGSPFLPLPLYGVGASALSHISALINAPSIDNTSESDAD
jgi:hypothetical protein